MRNKLLITAAFGTMMGTAVFAQSAPTTGPATGTGAAAIGAASAGAPATGTGTATPVPPAEQIRPTGPAPISSQQEAPKVTPVPTPQAAMPPAGGNPANQVQTGQNQTGQNQTGQSQMDHSQMGNNALMGTGHSGDQASAPAPRNFSTRASNILPSDTQSDIAPVLPTPPAGEHASAAQLLRDAQAALDRGQTGLAQEAMERAEARVLSRSMPASEVGTRVRGPVEDKLSQARLALGRNDIAASRALLDEALSVLNRSAMN